MTFALLLALILTRDDARASPLLSDCQISSLRALLPVLLYGKGSH